MKTITFLKSVIWAVNRQLIRHTPVRILDKFRSGRYLDYTDFCDGTAHRRGFLSWRRTRRLIGRCLNCGIYIKSHQDLNAEPLALTYLQTYYLLTEDKYRTKDFYYPVYDPRGYETRTTRWRSSLISKIGKEDFHILRQPMTAYLCTECVCPTLSEINRGVMEIQHLYKDTIFALSRDNGKVVCHTVTNDRFPVDCFDYPYPLQTI